MTYLLDTDWFINGLEGTGNYPERLRTLRPEGIAVSSVSIAEVLTGIVDESDEEERRSVLSEFLAPLTEIPFDHMVIDRFARIRKDLLRKHTPLENFDIAIAATALEYDLTLLTDNTEHFKRVKGLKLLKRR